MRPAEWQELDRLFDAALDLAEDARRALLERECRDPAARARVERLLAHAGDDGPELAPGGALTDPSWIDSLAAGERAPADELRGGTKLGPYLLLRILGQGGMGVVWLAEQLQPIRRQVALKIIPVGLQSAQVVARFESERQALARMGHPNIAQVYDAGTTDDGRPYFVMELVEGRSLTAYCDERRLTLEQRLELFGQVCRGVQHAHQKGVIHRDLKPSNVLVAEHGGVATPKIIDFGVAKAIGEELVAGASVTRAGHALGTPAYMSPEQARAGESEVDTRTDVYSLGVMLYRLLVGALPAELETIAGLAARRQLDRLRVPRPSARLTSLPDTGPQVARARGTSVESLARSLEADLDWIILKAMEPDPARRYATVDALAADLSRSLAHEPVEARPPSALYRLRKLVRRHRVGAVAAAVVALAVIGGAGLATHGMIRARVAEAGALEEAETARRVTDFMVELFRVHDPYESTGETVTARELLDRGADEVRLALTEEPRVQAHLLGAIGEAYLSLGLGERAEPLLLAALAERERRGGGQSLETAAALDALGELRVFQARYGEALDLLRRALEIKERRLGPAHEELAATLNLMSTAQSRAADYEEARRLARRALDIHRAEGSPRAIARSLRELGVIEAYEERHAEALALYEEAYATSREALGDDHPFTLDLFESMALALEAGGTPAGVERAIELHRRTLSGRRERFGEGHPTTAYSYHNLGRSLAVAGRHAEALPLYERAIEIRERALGPEHLDVAFTLESLAIAKAHTGDLEAANDAFQRALRISEEALGPNHPQTLETLQNLAMLAVLQGERELAVVRMEEAVRRGYAELEMMLGEPLDALLGDARYAALVERVRERRGANEREDG